jgi:chemotaxis protein MotB
VQDLQRRLTQAEGSRQGLQKELESLRAQLRREQDALEQKEEESNELLDAQRELAKGLKKELGDARAKLELTERGLVLTLLDEIFFDSGKAVIKEEGLQTLDKVAQVLRETVPDSPVAVEGHTDNEPIIYSSWLSNWELSSGRALAVLHHFAERRGIAPERLRAVAMGEFHPVASNDTAEGRRQNRRVEIVILPTKQLRIKNEE